MRLEHADPKATKGWYAGPWHSALPIAVGYANEGIDDPHVHARMTEIYLVARGSAELRVEQRTVRVAAGDMLALEPGEAHTFVSTSSGYFHFVLHVPGLPPEEARADRSSVPRSRLGLQERDQAAGGAGNVR